MSALLATTDILALGYRGVGARGQPAVDSYDQLSRLLRQTLGAGHAALLAEPSRRGARIDWFSDLPDTGGGAPVRLIDAPADRRLRGLDRLAGLVADIDAKGAVLAKSDRQDERILGDMLAHAMILPDEQHIVLVGDNPVLTVWGHRRENGQPAERVLDQLLRPRAEGGSLTPPPPPGAAVLPFPGVITDPRAAMITPRHRVTHWVRVPVMAALLWSLLLVALAVIAWELLHACPPWMPRQVNQMFHIACLASADDLRASEDEQTALRQQYDELITAADRKRATCRAAPPPLVPVTPPAVPPAPDNVLHLPPPPAPEDQGKPGQPAPKPDMSFLKGCWASQGPLDVISNGQKTGQQVQEMLCFDINGTGRRILRFTQEDGQCEGDLTAKWQGDTLTVNAAEARCLHSSHPSFIPENISCQRDSSGNARCSSDSLDGTLNYKELPFRRVRDNP